MQSVYKDFIYGICKLYTYIIEDVTFKQLLRLYAYTVHIRNTVQSLVMKTVCPLFPFHFVWDD